VDVTVNSLGLRGEEISLQKPDGVTRILVLGDSFTFGVYVDDQDTYPAVLQDLLRDAGQHVEVINAGYADGWDTDEHYAWLVNRGLEFSPDLIIYGFFIGNDIEELYSEFWEDLDSRGLPTKVVDSRYAVDEAGGLRALTGTSYSVGSLWLYRLPVLRESHVLLLLAKGVDQLIAALPFVSSADDAYTSTSLQFMYVDPSTEMMLKQEQLFVRLVTGMDEIAHENGAEFLVVMLPISYQITRHGTDFEPPRNYFEEIKPVLDSLGIRYLDMFELMLANPGHYFPDNGEVHNNENGYRFIAEEIRNYLLQNNLP
jgi:lysophospholipase L1-like esterase